MISRADVEDEKVRILGGDNGLGELGKKTKYEAIISG